MFTGIVRGTGNVVEQKKQAGRNFVIVQLPAGFPKTKVGGSVAINGVCLTLVKLVINKAHFEVMPETLRKTNLGELKKGSLVNVEPALRIGDELGGHLVQGHVDAIGMVKKIVPDGKNLLVEISLPKDLMKFTILHGSIALDGISLTIARKSKTTVTVSLIAETINRTTWKNIAVGRSVNIEVDLLAKYIKNFLK